MVRRGRSAPAKSARLLVSHVANAMGRVPRGIPAVDGQEGRVEFPAPQFGLLAFIDASVTRVEKGAALALDNITEIRIVVSLAVLVKKFVRRRDGAKVYSARFDRLAVVQANEPVERDGEFFGQPFT